MMVVDAPALTPEGSPAKPHWWQRYRYGFLTGLVLSVALFVGQRIAINLTFSALYRINAETPFLFMAVSALYALASLGLVAWVHHRCISRGHFRFAAGVLHMLLLNVALWVAVVGYLQAMYLLGG